jgi:hypothetical protein
LYIEYVSPFAKEIDLGVKVFHSLVHGLSFHRGSQYKPCDSYELVNFLKALYNRRLSTKFSFRVFLQKR